MVQEIKGNPKNKRVGSIDGLKGIMILAIIIYYYFQNYLPGGFLAVNTFFVIGGYLAFRDNKHLFHKKPVELKLSSKLSRLWLPMLFMIVGVVAFLFIALPDQLKNIRMMSLSSLVFFNNYYQIINQQSYFIQSINPSPFVHLWYVSLYLQLMLLATVIRKIFNRLNLLRMQESVVLMVLSILSAIAMSLLYVIQQDPSYLYYAIGTRIFAFLFGGVLSYFTEGKLSLPLSKSIVSIVITQIVGLVSFLIMIWMMVTFNGIQKEDGSSVIHLASQFIFIILLAEVTYRVFEKKSWSIPIGQSFNLLSIPEFLSKEMQPTKKLLGIGFSFTYVILIGLAIVGFFQSSTETNLVAQQLESVIKRNQELIEHTTAEESTTINPNKEIELKEQIAQEAVTFVGDSILLAAADKVQELFPKATIDGKVGRQLYSSPTALQELIAKDKMANRVVTLLGTNGTFSQKQLDEYIRILGEERELYFVTIFAPVKWNNEVNQQLLEAKTRHANVHIIDWFELAKNHADWFYEDKIHPNNQGAEELAKYLLDSITQIKMNQ